MNTFVAPLEKYRSNPDDVAFYNDAFRMVLKWCLRDFPHRVPGTLISWMQDETIDLMALPEPALNLMAKPVCWEIVYQGYCVVLSHYAENNIQKDEDGNFNYVHQGWEIKITQDEIIEALHEYFTGFKDRHSPDVDLNCMFSAVNLYSQENREATLTRVVLETANDKWSRIMAEQARKATEPAQEPAKKRGWLDRLLFGDK